MLNQAHFLWRRWEVLGPRPTPVALVVSLSNHEGVALGCVSSSSFDKLRMRMNARQWSPYGKRANRSTSSA